MAPSTPVAAMIVENGLPGSSLVKQPFETLNEIRIADCAGLALPRYNYALGARSKIARVHSATDFGRVPSLGDLSSSSLSGSSDDEDFDFGMAAVPQKSLLDCKLLDMWQESAKNGFFRYDVTLCPTKILPGKVGFVAQLNEGRATKKRATEFSLDKVCQPFDEAKFNFKKAAVQEVLFQFEQSSGRASSFDTAPCAKSPNLVVINVSPIEYGHILLVPSVLDCCPQLVDIETTLLALRFAAEAGNPYLRVGYNSLGAYATINHLHFQAYYLIAPFPVEMAATTLLKGAAGKRDKVQVYRLVDYPVRGFVFESNSSLEELATAVGQACMKLQAENIPHNLFISNNGKRVFLFPQCYAEKQAKGLVPEALLATGVNPACWEIAGHLVLKSKKDYDTINQSTAWDLLAAVSYSEDEFMSVSQICFG